MRKNKLPEPVKRHKKRATHNISISSLGFAFVSCTHRRRRKKRGESVKLCLFCALAIQYKMWFVSQSAHTNRRRHQFLIFNRFSRSLSLATYNFFLRFARCRRFSVYQPARNPCKFQSVIVGLVPVPPIQKSKHYQQIADTHHLNAYAGTPTHRHCFIRLPAH